MKGLIAIASLVLVVSILASGCARPAPAPSPSPAAPAPTPAPATKAAPAPAPKPPAAPPAPAPKPDPLAQIIEGAKREGAVSASLVASYTPAPVVQKLRNNIKEKYGVDLDIKVAASPDMAGILARAVMEYKTGAAPTFDIITLGSDYIPQGNKEGAFEKVDWKANLPPGTPAGIVPENPLLSSGPILDSDATGLVYNPSKVPAGQVPRTLSDLADPKWKGKLAIMEHSAYYARWAFILGKDKTLATIRAIVKTRPIVSAIITLNNRYLVGEADMIYMSSSFVVSNRDKGMPTDFRALDILEIRDYQLSVVKNARNPNAARLLAVYLASPEGVKFVIQDVKKSHMYYPGNHVYDTAIQAKKDGIPVHTLDNSPKVVDFILSPEYDKLQKEIEIILKE